jgi:hypothetical protein
MFVSLPKLRATLAALVVASSGLAAATAPAVAAVEDQPAAAAQAAAWVAAELDQPEPSFDVFGKTAARTDVVFALAAVGGEEGAARQALADLEAGAESYIGPANAANVGALAKVLLAVEIAGVDAATFVEGRDLEAELRASMDPSGIFASEVFSQSLAMIALGATPGGVPAAATAALEGMQCADGDFTFLGTCPGGPIPDVDTTALAIQALIAAGSDGAASVAADLLADTQNADGSWPNAFGDPNTNSAGVAGQALRAAGRVDAADLAAEFVMSLQTEDGGIRFVEAETEANGFATLQGVLALGGGPYHDLALQAFADVPDDHLFATEIAWLGFSGISQGCDPPADDNFCPDANLTRGEMAAFLVRALDLTDPGDDTFTDDDGSVFEGDIRRLAAAGITKGCNPPTNDNFCPDASLARGEMAALLFRALGG